VASHLGGTRDPLIVSWPGHIKDAGGLRSQFHHVTDIAPTIYELAGIEFPSEVRGVKQLPLEGNSMVYTFDHPDTPSLHKIQYFEMVGNRGIYKDGWWAGSRNTVPWAMLGLWSGPMPPPHAWELYNLNEDYSQAHDLAAQNPEKLKELEQLFDSEARRNNVYPLLPYPALEPAPNDGAKSFVYRAGIQRISAPAAPHVVGRPHRITATVDVPAGGAEGVILAQGGIYGGYTLFVKDGRVGYQVNGSGNRAGGLLSTEPLAAGKSEIVLDYMPDKAGLATGLSFFLTAGSGTARLSINGKPAGEAKIASFGGYGLYFETLDVGSELGTPVTSDYTSPFAFTGKIETVKVDVQ
jgi:arylsulfatase